MSFKNKVVLVTGGGAGIGAATVIAFAAEGATLAIVDKDQDLLKAIAKKLHTLGNTCLTIHADLSKDAETKTIIEKTVKQFSRLDVLVNNAGIASTAAVTDEKLLPSFDEMMRVNLRSVILLTNLAALHLAKTKGCIVNLSSIAATITTNVDDLTFLGGYSATKAGVSQFSRVAAYELASKGIRVNTVSPGIVNTSIMAHEWLSLDDYANKTPLKIITQPEEVADLILFLASEKARSITGSDFKIDCGLSLA